MPTKFISFTQVFLSGISDRDFRRDSILSDPSHSAPAACDPTSSDSPAVAGEAPCHDALALTQGGPVATIFLDDKRYALRITRQRKLILTK